MDRLGGSLRFNRKILKTKKLGLVHVYTPVEIPRQLRYMLSADGRRIILANSSSYEFLRELFLIIAKTRDTQALFHIKDNSPDKERFQEWFKLGDFHLDFLVSNYDALATKPKYIKEVIDKSKYLTADIIDLETDNQIMADMPYWKTDGIVHFKTYSKYLLCSTNELGFNVLAQSAMWLTGYEDEETYMCDGHTHLCGYSNEEDVDTDYWYFYQEEDRS